MLIEQMFLQQLRSTFQSFVRLKELKGQLDVGIHYHMFTFFLGYISHVLADGIIHPFVRDKVGEYSEKDDFMNRTLRS